MIIPPLIVDYIGQYKDSQYDGMSISRGFLRIWVGNMQDATVKTWMGKVQILQSFCLKWETTTPSYIVVSTHVHDMRVLNPKKQVIFHQHQFEIPSRRSILNMVIFFGGVVSSWLYPKFDKRYLVGLLISRQTFNF